RTVTRIVALWLAAVTVSVCFGLPIQKVVSITTSQSKADPPARIGSQPKSKVALLREHSRDAEVRVQSDAGDKRGPEVTDSDAFFQKASQNTSRARSQAQKVEALLNRMTIEEKV